MRLPSTLRLTETAQLVEGMIEEASKATENAREKQVMVLEIMRMWELAIAQREKEVQSREKDVVGREEAVFQRETHLAKRDREAGKGTSNTKHARSKPAVHFGSVTEEGRQGSDYTTEDTCNGNPSKKQKTEPATKDLEVAVEKIILQVGRDVTLRDIKEGLQKSYPRWDVEACREELRAISVRMVTELGIS